jgi:hypothetical protein
MSNTADVSYKWSEKGMQPMVEQKQNKRERVTLFGAVDPIWYSYCTTSRKRKRKNILKFFKKDTQILQKHKRKNSSNFR